MKSNAKFYNLFVRKHSARNQLLPNIKTFQVASFADKLQCCTRRDEEELRSKRELQESKGTERERERE